MRIRANPGLRGSADSVIANVAQQAAGVLLFLLVPNILPASEYAVVVIASVILGFARFSDLGLSSVYGRDLPRHYGSGELARVEPWNTTLLWFGALGGALAGIVAAVALVVAGGSPGNAAILALVPPLMALTSAYVSFATVRGDFRRYRDAQIVLAIGKLLAVPLAFLLGLAGWFIAQVAGLALVLARSGLKWIPVPPRIEWTLVKEHLPSALQLAMISLLWAQLMDSARLFATIHYGADAIATYGIVAAGYQSASGLVIAMFLPVSINTLQSLGRSDGEAVAYVHDAICRSLPWVFALAVVGGELAPWFLQLVFPRYAVDPVMARTMLYGVSVLPILATSGNLLIGAKRTMVYALVLGVAMSAAAAAEMVLRPYVGTRAAAFGQVTGAFLLSALLLIAVRMCFQRASRERTISWWRPGLLLAGLWAAYLVARTWVTETWP